MQTQYALLAKEFINLLDGTISIEELITRVNEIKAKRWGCQYIQDAIFFRSDEIRTCCKRFFVDGKRKGDVKLAIKDLTKLDHLSIASAKSQLVMGINNDK